MRERRYVPTEFELRDAPDGGKVVEGYAAKYGRMSRDLGGFVERINPGAFSKTLQEADVRAYFNHDRNLILGRRTAGTLRLSDDETGLYYSVDVPDTTAGRDLIVSMERGDVRESSFAFSKVGADGDTWDETDQGYPLRSLNQVRLYDVSPVVEPAYEDTSSTVRGALVSLAEARGLPIDDLTAAAADGHLAELLSADRFDLRGFGRHVAARATARLEARDLPPDQLAALFVQLDTHIDAADDIVDALLAAYGVPDLEAEDGEVAADDDEAVEQNAAPAAETPGHPTSPLRLHRAQIELLRLRGRA